MAKPTPNRTETATASSEARAQRLRHIRVEILRYSREKFGRKHQIPASTIHNWEIAKYGGLTEKGAIKLIKAFHAEGVPCTVEWLLYGIGEKPSGFFLAEKLADHSPSNLAEELQLFHKNNPNAVDAIIADDGIEPCFTIGDHVAGIRFFENDLDKAIGTVSIIQTIHGEVLVRKLDKGSKSKHYDLSCINPKTTVKKSASKNVAVFSAAPVVWFRRPIKN